MVKLAHYRIMDRSFLPAILVIIYFIAMSSEPSEDPPARPAPAPSTALATLADLASFPQILQRAGGEALFAADEFFSARLANEHTRRAYGRAVRDFFVWCEAHGLELRQISPGAAARFINGLTGGGSRKKVYLAALRQLFDVLVTRHAVVLNPFASVRGPRAQSGNTPAISVEQARQLLAAIDTSRPVGLRDRAVLGTLTYTGARVGAVAALRFQDLRDYGDHRALFFREKRGKTREIPIRIKLDRWIADYIDAARIGDDAKQSPLFRLVDRQSPTGLASKGVRAWTIRNILKRRLKEAGLPETFTPHSFRVMVVTDLLEQGVPMEDVQHLAGHSHPSTTQVYDRRERRVTRNIVERISV